MRHILNIQNYFGLFAVLMLLIINPIFGQQKIQIKEGTADVGHFSVELLHNQPGAPMKSFSGNDGTIQVDNTDNKFILRIRNLVWFTKEDNISLEFIIDKISAQTNSTVSFDQAGKSVYLNPEIQALVTDINFAVSGYGKVKLSIPFQYEDGEGRFLQEFNINEKTTEVSAKESFAGRSAEEADKTLSKSDFRKLWKNVDTEDPLALATFVSTYRNDENAAKYILLAEKKIAEISKKLESKVKVEKEAIANQEELLEDISSIVDSLHFDAPPEKGAFYNLNLFIENELDKSLEVHSNEMPLQLNFHQVGEETDILLNAIPVYAFSSDTTINISSELLKEHKLSGDFSSFRLLNAQGNEIYKTGININTIGKAQSNTLLYILALSGLLLAFGGFVLFSKRRKEKERAKNKIAFQEKIKANQANINTEAPNQNVQNTSENVSSSTKTKIKIGVKNTEKEALIPKTSVAREMGTSSRIKIKSRKKSGVPVPYDKFVEIVNESNTVNVDLSKIWTDSRIKNVYLSPQYIQDLDNFLAESSNDGIQNELQGAIPEVGGFMMGRFSELNGKLEVIVEKFVPFVPEYNDVFKIEIGTKTLVDELGDAQDRNPELEVIGWFHTHPGHGLFLSTSDLSVQRHFPNDYQVAMEIDSLTSGLDMSIFTRKENGRMNNSNDRVENRGWFQWVDIENSNVSKI